MSILKTIPKILEMLKEIVNLSLEEIWETIVNLEGNCQS